MILINDNRFVRLTGCEEDLILYYDFNEGGGTEIYDKARHTYSLLRVCQYGKVAEPESSRASLPVRKAGLAKPQKAQSTFVNEHFWGERNAAIGL